MSGYSYQFDLYFKHRKALLLITTTSNQSEISQSTFHHVRFKLFPRISSYSLNRSETKGKNMTLNDGIPTAGKAYPAETKIRAIIFQGQTKVERVGIVIAGVFDQATGCIQYEITWKLKDGTSEFVKVDTKAVKTTRNEVVEIGDEDYNASV